VLSSLEIKNFRTFSHLFIERLGRVNLVVGKNNVGKTTLLEALRLYGSIWPRSTIASILHERNEVAGSAEGKTVLLFPSLFHGRQAQEGDEISIREVAGGESPHAFSAVARAEKEPTSAADMFEAVAAGLVLDVSWPGRKFTLRADGSASYAIASKSPKPPEVSPDPPCLRGVGIQCPVEDMIADWWDGFALTEAEQRVVAALQIIAPIRGVRFIGDPRSDRGRTARVRVDGISEPVALASQGDGLVRMFQIAAAMEYAAVRARQASSADPGLPNVFPLLLIDEIEVGIHHTLHADLWGFIFSAARLLDVQVFATTHSWDCLKGFAEAVKGDDQADGLAIRLERIEGKKQTGAVIIDRDDLPIVLRDSIEVR